MGKLTTLLFVLIAAGNLTPVVGVLSESRLRALYGVALDDPNLLILMRHRAVLFGVVGGLLLASAFHVPLRPLGVAVGLVSMLSFILIAAQVGDYNAELRRVMVIDGVGCVLLVIAGLLSSNASNG